ncbi:hypothetical protein JOS77_10850 [Chromobacterium haemolyticum]|uniref:glyoxalase/bleomycin resistance/dioxygenase family protein n=1 Tax=Chromobacterium haemolyticum TaxID=394935 RepID=UPI000DEEE072|nr:glyoxalase/bleomycin resistance/dioxygenase family protein [Chromobacterium haemolyticum]UGA39846.1 hypothetical protein JOS77_10850 [Chromobacterium haemolyticum]
MSAAGPIAAVLIHVADWRAGLAWYQRAFPAAQAVDLPEFDFACLEWQGVRLEIVQADAKVGSGAAGSVVYWRSGDLDADILRLTGLGAALYRGPLAIEKQQGICQLRDPWGNCIGLRGPWTPASRTRTP